MPSSMWDHLPGLSLTSLWLYVNVWGQKKKSLVLPSIGIFERLGQLVDFFFFNYYFKSTQIKKMGVFSTIFLKKPPIWTKLGAFSTIYFEHFWLGLVLVRATQQFFFSWPNAPSLCSYKQALQYTEFIHFVKLCTSKWLTSHPNLHEVGSSYCVIIWLPLLAYSTGILSNM